MHESSFDIQQRIADLLQPYLYSEDEGHISATVRKQYALNVAGVLVAELKLTKVYTPISTETSEPMWEGDFYRDRYEAEKATWQDGGTVGEAWLSPWVKP